MWTERLGKMKFAISTSIVSYRIGFYSAITTPGLIYALFQHVSATLSIFNKILNPTRAQSWLRGLNWHQFLQTSASKEGKRGKAASHDISIH